MNFFKNIYNYFFGTQPEDNETLNLSSSEHEFVQEGSDDAIPNREPKVASKTAQNLKGRKIKKPTYSLVNDDDESIDASGVSAESVDAIEKTPPFDKLVSKAKNKELNGHKFISFRQLNINSFEDIVEDGSNLLSEDREMYLAYKAQGKKLGNMDEFFGEYCTTWGGTVGYCFQEARVIAKISSEDLENIWRVVWTSNTEDPDGPTDDEVNAILDTIRGHVGCDDEGDLKDIVKSAIAIKRKLVYEKLNGCHDEIVGLFALDCECSTLKLGKNSDNPIDGAILYVDKGETYVNENNGKTYNKATPVSIKTDEEGKLYFEYHLDAKREPHTVKEGDDEYAILGKALHDAFVFEPTKNKREVMPSQEKLDIDKKLAIFIEKNKKATDTAPAEPLDPVAAAAAKVNIEDIKRTFKFKDNGLKFSNMNPLPAENIQIKDIRNADILSKHPISKNPNISKDVRSFFKGMKWQRKFLSKYQRQGGWNINDFDITDEQKLEVAKYLQGKYCEKFEQTKEKIEQAREEFEQACAKIGFVSDEQKDFIYDLIKNSGFWPFRMGEINTKPGFSEMAEDDIESACNAADSLSEAIIEVYEKLGLGSEDMQELSKIIGMPIAVVGNDLGYTESTPMAVFANGKKYDSQLKFKDYAKHSVLIKIIYVDSESGETVTLTPSQAYLISRKHFNNGEFYPRFVIPEE